jgi:5-methylcytosine-specific restriction protein A
MSATSSSIPFAVGRQYTRADVFDLLGIQPHPTGGNWFTGYNRHGDDWYVFCHIHAAGRTGHDYDNAWEGDLLRWRGKTGSQVRQDSIRSMLAPGRRVLVFTREQNRDPFTYQGLAHAERSEDTDPVTIWWRFSVPSIVEGAPSPSRADGRAEDAGHGAGFGRYDDNLAVERAAVEHVAALYRAAVWVVTSVERERVGYDLRCVRGEEERHVEVKGVSATVPGFMLTEGERRAAESDSLWWVAVVTEALGPAPRCVEVHGGELLSKWSLVPVAWRVSAPAKAQG